MCVFLCVVCATALNVTETELMKLSNNNEDSGDMRSYDTVSPHFTAELCFSSGIVCTVQLETSRVQIPQFALFKGRDL